MYKIQLIYKLLISIILFSFTFCDNATIKGSITDISNKQILIGANIILLDTDYGSASNQTGEYIINNIVPGQYIIKAMFIGYESTEQSIIIESNNLYTVNINLKPSTIELQTTRVTAEKRKEKVTDAPASIEIISSRDIKRETTTNMGSYLKGMKGVDFTSSGINNYSISIRGFNSSFNTRVLTLTDGRVANIPALRVINYSSVPQSMDDIERMEVVLGPATALYGANAHSGVVNIISKAPSQSEGLTMNVSGSNDERQLRKINGRWAKKLSNTLSIKLSGMYLHGYEWPYISEEEYKNHLYPWSGNPYRVQDKKDNNPWPDKQCPTTCYADSAINIYNKKVAIGDGEPNHGDLDGDGVAGEDWFNGYDDDGDGLIDEDYFTADEIDNDGDGLIDEGIDEPEDAWTDGYDNDQNGKIDDRAEMYVGLSGNSDDEPIWGHNIENNIIIKGGRKNQSIGNEPNPWYVEGSSLQFSDLRGDYYYDEKNVKYFFDVYVYDWGDDGIPGDPYFDKPGDGIFQPGEGPLKLKFGQYLPGNDCGLDGLCEGDIGYIKADYGEGDNDWQPGDCFIDLNGNNLIDWDPFTGSNEYNEDCNEDSDAYPLPNGSFDIGHDQILGDWGNDGIEGTSDPGENDGLLIPYDSGENDNIFDTGDGNFGWPGDDYEDANSNGRWDPGEILISDLNGDGLYTPPDYIDNFDIVEDINGDGLSDFPDFEVENRKLEFRLDYDPTKNINLTFQGGYSWTKTQQVTGTSRYLADGFEYKYFQLRGRFENWYSQLYMNESFSGNTRSYNLGSIIHDESKNYAFQLQRNHQIKRLNSKLVWGFDYFQTLPFTNGTILNDGPNGYDNDGDNQWFSVDNIDNDNDGEIDEKYCEDGIVDEFKDGIPDDSGRKDGKPWRCDEGIDEPDEFINPISNEYGFYYQTTTELFGTSRYELITAARWDMHDLLDEKIQFAPKLGFIFKPDEKSSFRFTYGKAFNTPNSVTLYTDLHIRKQGIMDVYLRGNKDGTPYCRVGQPCASQDQNENYTNPGFYYCDGDSTNNDGSCKGNTFFNTISPLSDDYFSGNENLLSYKERVHQAPYFYNQLDSDAPNDMIPLDTLRYLIFVPELNGEGVLYTPEQSWGINDIEPIKTEKIQTFEFGYKGFISKRTHISLDYYISHYKDFFSPPTFITPTVVLRSDTSYVGLLPVNSFASFPPYATAWNGLDDDGDWAIWADEFGWDDDKDGDDNPMDIGEWGFINYYDAYDSTNYEIIHPKEVLIPNENGAIIWMDNDSKARWTAVGIDEYDPNTGFNEAESIETFVDANNQQIYGAGLANSPPHLILSPMNYGSVWMQGLDIGITHFIPEYHLIIDGNISWYGTTEYYNKLTLKNDPINAPEWKWNGSIKWDNFIGSVTLNYRHVNKFKWNDGIWVGTIGPYDIYDLHYNYLITENLELSFSALNIFNNQHKELIGGAEMGRQLIIRLSSKF